MDGPLLIKLSLLVILSSTSETHATCDAQPIFTGALVEQIDFNLFWNLSDCSRKTELYCINYTKCDDSSLIDDKCTFRPPLKYQKREYLCDEAYFTLRVRDGGCCSKIELTCDILLQQTGQIFLQPHNLTEVTIFPVPLTDCTSLDFCIFPDQNDSSGKCYMKPELNKLPREYGISDPINPNTTEFTFVIRNVTKRMNGTLHTLRCDTPCCGGNVTPCSIVVNSTMLIVADPPSQPETPCLYLNNTNATLCTTHPDSTITIISFAVNSDCDSYTLIPNDLCKPFELTSNCTPTKFSISARNEVGASIPSESVPVKAHTEDYGAFCTCLVASSFIPKPQLLVEEQGQTSLRLEVQQPPSNLPDTVKIVYCQANASVQVTKEENDSCTICPEWTSCNTTETMFVGIIQLERSELCTHVSGNFTITITVPIYVADSPDPCHLQTNPNTTSFLEQDSKNKEEDSTGAIVGGAMVGFFGLILGIVLIMIVVEIQKRKKMSEDEKQASPSFFRLHDEKQQAIKAGDEAAIFA